MLEDTFSTEAHDTTPSTSANVWRAAEPTTTLSVWRAKDGTPVRAIPPQDARAMMRRSVERQILRAAAAPCDPRLEAASLKAATLALQERRRWRFLDRLYHAARELMAAR